MRNIKIKKNNGHFLILLLIFTFNNGWCQTNPIDSIVIIAEEKGIKRAIMRTKHDLKNIKKIGRNNFFASVHKSEKIKKFTKLLEKLKLLKQQNQNQNDRIDVNILITYFCQGKISNEIILSNQNEFYLNDVFIQENNSLIDDYLADYLPAHLGWKIKQNNKLYKKDYFSFDKKMKTFLNKNENIECSLNMSFLVIDINKSQLVDVIFDKNIDDFCEKEDKAKIKRKILENCVFEKTPENINSCYDFIYLHYEEVK